MDADPTSQQREPHCSVGREVGPRRGRGPGLSVDTRLQAEHGPGRPFFCEEWAGHRPVVEAGGAQLQGPGPSSQTGRCWAGQQGALWLSLGGMEGGSWELGHHPSLCP